MTIYRYIEFTENENIPQFTAKANPPFTSKVSFYAIRNKRRIDVCDYGLPRSVLGTEILYSNQKTDSPIASCSFSPDGLKIICVTTSNRGYLYDLTQSPTKPPLNLGPDIVRSCFLGNERIVFSNNIYDIFEISCDQPNNRRKISSLPTCDVNSIDKIKDAVFISTSVGVYLNSKRIHNTKTFSCVSDGGTNVYFLTVTGFIQYDMKTQTITTLLTTNKILSYLHCESLDLTQTPFCFASGHLILCTSNTVLGFNLKNNNVGPIYNCPNGSESFQGIVSDNNELYLFTPLKLMFLTFPAYKAMPIYSDSTDFISQLSNLLKGKDIDKQKLNDTTRIVETANLLQQNPDQHNLLLPLMIDDYCNLPINQSSEVLPLLLHNLKRFKGSVPFDVLYQKLSANGREMEIWGFLQSFDVVNEGMLLKTVKGNKIPSKDLIGYLKKCDPDKINAADITENYPEISHHVFKAVGDAAAPFLLGNFDQVDLEGLQSMKTGNGSVIDARVCERLGEKPAFVVNTAFYLLDTAKQRGDWNEAAQFAAELGLEEEMKLCKSKMNNSADIRAKLLKANLDINEQNEILEQLVNELETAAPTKRFEDYFVFAKSITKRIDSEMKTAGEKRSEESQIIDDLIRQRVAMRGEKVTVKETDLCAQCKRPLGKGKISVFSCGHAFHEACKIAAEEEIRQIEARLKKKRPMKMRGCTVCGIQSSLKTYLQLTNSKNEWTLDF